jgi:tRNA pseudouridine38-40 synthase
VQDELEVALGKTCGALVSVVGAGRTDAGVHATGQVIAFEAPWSHPLTVLLKAVNARLPADVALLEIAECEVGFHPRFSARSRVYEYTVFVAAARQPLRRRYAWQVEHDLDLEAMNRASARLIGEHDFAAFGTAPQGDVTVRTVLRAGWERCADRAALAAGHGLRFTVEANAFLFRMVRRMVITLARAGRGQLSADDVNDILASKDSRRVKGTAPACGLCLVKVTY